MSSENWVPVQGFEGSYEVSNLGHIRSLDRTLSLPCGQKRRYRGKVLAESRDSKGYVTAHLTDGRTKAPVRLHRLVAQAFVPNPDNLPQVNHIDGNKRNNAAANLEWVTDAQNKQHALEHGLAPLFDRATGRWKKRCA